MQAALYIRGRKKDKKLRGRCELPSNVATKEIPPFPHYPPPVWGKAATAWSERERRTSGSGGEGATNHRTRQREAHGRWMKRNRRKGLQATPDMRNVRLVFPRAVTRNVRHRRITKVVQQRKPPLDIHDSSYGGSSSEEEELVAGLYGHQSAAANALLYVGLGTVAIGLVIAFVGTGEKGFKTLELRLIGPTLIGSGVLCCLVRIFLCVCPTRCLKRRFRHRHRRKHQAASATPGAQLNRHGFQSDKCTDYYRHLPYSRAGQEFVLEQPKKSKKRVSIIPAGGAAAMTMAVPQIHVPSVSPDGTCHSADDVHSVSSEDSFNDSLLLDNPPAGQLTSTLTFHEPETEMGEQASLRPVSRIDEEDSDALDDSTPLTPSCHPSPPHSPSPMLGELVLSPATLQNGD